MTDESTKSQTTGVAISGGTITVAGDIVGGNKHVGTQISLIQIAQAFRPIEEAIHAAAPADPPAASQKLEELKTEAAKGKDAKDGTVAKLIEGLVALVPSGVSAIVSAFSTPLLGGIAGPATKYVLDKIQGE